MSSTTPDRQETMTHGLRTDSIKETVLMLIEAYPDKAWLVSILCGKIFIGQEIRDSHKRALRDILSQLKLPKNWIYHPLRYQELDGVLYNINSEKSRKQSDSFTLGSTHQKKYNQVLKEEIDLERKSLEPKAAYDLDHNHQSEKESNYLSSTKERDLKSISLEKVDSILRKIDDL